MSERAPVIIVGAGPAGAALAFVLVSRGIGVKLIERQSDFAREFRGELSAAQVTEALSEDFKTSPLKKA